MTRRASTLAEYVQPRLVVTVAAMALLVVLSTLFAAHAILYGQLDTELDNTRVRQGRGPEGSHVPGISVPGMQTGTVIAVRTPKGSAGGRINDGGVEDMPPEALRALLSVPADNDKRSVNVPGLGAYRVMAGDTALGRVVVGLPLTGVQHTLLLLAVFVSSVGVVAVAATSLVTRTVLGRATKPLRALGATADAVSKLDLERGTVTVPRADVAEDTEHNEVTRLAIAFNHMLSRVEDALAVRESSEAKLRQFVADASHELRNPLASIRGYAELAERASDADQTAHALGRISSESRRMTKLVNDLLLLARLDADAPTQPRPVDVVEVALGAVSDAQASGREHTWRVDLPDDAIEIMGDADQLHQVMVNLLGNARTHTPPGTTVTTSVNAEDAYAVIRVCDDGPGMDSATAHRVFERFSRADTSRAHSPGQSTGLGLAIVRAVVEGLNGCAEVESRPGCTVFTVRLPIAEHKDSR